MIFQYSTSQVPSRTASKLKSINAGEYINCQLVIRKRKMKANHATIPSKNGKTVLENMDENIMHIDVKNIRINPIKPMKNQSLE